MFEKNGFVLTETVEDELVTAAGIKTEGSNVLLWKYDDKEEVEGRKH